MPENTEKIETPAEAAERRCDEIRRVLAEIPTRSDQISYAFLRKEFVEAATRPLEESH